MAEEKYPIDYNSDYHSLRIIPDNLNIFNSKGTYNGRSTWQHWMLMPTSRPVINPAPFKSNFISIPGGNGSIDASTVLTNYPMYEDRSGSIEFQSVRDYGSPTSWIRTYELIQNYLHGRIFKVILYDDPGFYYRGRMTINQWKSNKDWSALTFDYRFEPFKYWIGSDDYNKENYSDILVVGSGFQTERYYVPAKRSFNHADLTEYQVDKYGLPNDVGWTMPVSPEIIIQPLVYANMTPYIPPNGNPELVDNYSYAIATFTSVTSDPKIKTTKVKITGRVGSGNKYVRLWAFLDENYNVLSKAENNPSGTTIEAIAPEGAKYLVVNAYKNESRNIRVLEGESIGSYTWHDGAFIPIGLEVTPSPQSPSSIRFVQGVEKNGLFIQKAELTYNFTDTNQHSVNAYGILFNNDVTVIRVYAQAYQQFKVSYRFKRGLL